ncbi:transcriptional repressor [Acinetobacter sp.]|uniref:transcriptional repressor n=1 Tax=Acinetobacter sp. TaxID=472 RepID=UPI0035B4DC21
MSHLNIRNGEAAKLYELLRDSNLQVTVARLVILGIIKQSEHELTAAQIMRHTAFRTAKISFGVVYATLNTCILTHIVISSHYTQTAEFGCLLKLRVWSKDKTCCLP